MKKIRRKIYSPLYYYSVIALLFFFFLNSLPCGNGWGLAFAYTDNYPLGARSMAMANASAALADIWSVHHNQAALAYQKNFAVGLTYESKFFVPSLGLKGASAVIPTGSGVFGLDVSSFGYSKYNENKLGIGYGRTFGEYFSAGIQLDYLRTQIAENYGNKGVIAGEAGVQAKLFRNFIIGAHIFNLNRAKGATYNNEKIPTIMRAGFSYTFSDKVIISVESEKDIDFKPAFKFGIEYHVIESLYLRGGTTTYPFTNSFGAGFVMRNFYIDIAASMHPVLGYSSQMSLSYKFGKPEDEIQKKKSAVSTK